MATRKRLAAPMENGGIAACHLLICSIEVERNFVRKRPDGLVRLHILMSQIEISSTLAVLEEGHDLPDTDKPILAAAIASQCSVLLTGDIADFGHLIGSKWQGIRVMTVNMFLT